MTIGQLIKKLQKFERKYGENTDVQVYIKSSASALFDELHDILDIRTGWYIRGGEEGTTIRLLVQRYEDDETWLEMMGEMLEMERAIQRLDNELEDNDAN